MSRLSNKILAEDHGNEKQARNRTHFLECDPKERREVKNVAKIRRDIFTCRVTVVVTVRWCSEQKGEESRMRTNKCLQKEQKYGGKAKLKEQGSDKIQSSISAIQF